MNHYLPALDLDVSLDDIPLQVPIIQGYGEQYMEFLDAFKKSVLVGNIKIVVVGLGYVGISNAVLSAQHNEVISVEISQERVDI